MSHNYNAVFHSSGSNLYLRPIAIEEKEEEEVEEEEKRWRKRRREAIHNYHAIFRSNATELYSWQTQLFLSSE